MQINIPEDEFSFNLDKFISDYETSEDAAEDDEDEE